MTVTGNLVWHHRSVFCPPFRRLQEVSSHRWVCPSMAFSSQAWGSHMLVSSSLRMPCHFFLLFFSQFGQNEWGQIHVFQWVSVGCSRKAGRAVQKHRNPFCCEAVIGAWAQGVGVPCAPWDQIWLSQTSGSGRKDAFCEEAYVILTLQILGGKKGEHHLRCQMHFGSHVMCVVWNLSGAILTVKCFKLWCILEYTLENNWYLIRRSSSLQCFVP